MLFRSLRDAVRAAGRTGLDLPGVRGDRQIRDEAVLGLAAAVADDRAVVVTLGQFDGVHGLGQAADLVHLHQDRVRAALLDAAGEELRVGDEQVVADELHPIADRTGERAPSVPVVLVHTVFDADDGEIGDHLGVELDHLFGRLCDAFDVVHAVLIELSSSNIHG